MIAVKFRTVDMIKNCRIKGKKSVIYYAGDEKRNFDPGKNGNHKTDRLNVRFKFM